jgi:hypothetical protein
LHQRADRRTFVDTANLGTARNQARAESLIDLNVVQHSVIARLEHAQSDHLMGEDNHAQGKHGQFQVDHDSTLR